MPRSQFTEIEALADKDGVIAVISERQRNNAPNTYSVAIMKEFDRNGEPTRTAFISRRHIAGARRLLDKAEEALDQLEDRARAAERKRGPCR